MMLLTKAIEKSFVKQGYTGDKSADQIKILAHWFNPYGGGDWYLYERDANEPDIFWCFANLGDPTYSECGTVSMKEIQSLKVAPFGLGIEREYGWDTNTTLEDIRNKVQS